MKPIDFHVALKTFTAGVLCFSLVAYPNFSHSSAKAAAADLKSEATFRSEAGRYQKAISEIRKITTMKLETPDDLKQAIAILERESPNLKFQLSSLVVTALGDTAFTSAAKRRAPDKQAVEAFIKKLSADPNAIYEVSGAQSLKTRLAQNSEADSAMLRQVGTRLREAAERIKRTNQKTGRVFGPAANLKVMRASFTVRNHATRSESNRAAIPNTLVIPLITYVIVVTSVLFYAAFVAEATGVFAAVDRIAKNFGTEEGRDEVATCVKEADKERESCLSAANSLPFPLNLAGAAWCWAEWTGDVALCAVS